MRKHGDSSQNALSLVVKLLSCSSKKRKNGKGGLPLSSICIWENVRHPQCITMFLGESLQFQFVT